MAFACGHRHALRRSWRMLLRAHTWGELRTWHAGRAAAEASAFPRVSQCTDGSGRGDLVDAGAGQGDAGAGALSADGVSGGATGVRDSVREASGARGDAWVATRRMDRQLGWGYAAQMRAARRRKWFPGGRLACAALASAP